MFLTPLRVASLASVKQSVYNRHESATEQLLDSCCFLFTDGQRHLEDCNLKAQN